MHTKLFPQPVELPGMRARWRLSDLEIYETGHTDRTLENEEYWTASQLAKRYKMSRVAVWKNARLARLEAEASA